MKNLFSKILVGLVLILLALVVYNNKIIESKNTQIALIENKQQETQDKLDRLSTQLNVLVDQVEIANKSYRQLTVKLDAIDKKKQNYTEEVRKIKNENEVTKQILDTKLPAEFKRLLNDAIHE